MEDSHSTARKIKTPFKRFATREVLTKFNSLYKTMAISRTSRISVISIVSRYRAIMPGKSENFALIAASASFPGQGGIPPTAKAVGFGDRPNYKNAYII
ncbi:hypothetical protein SDC9_94170 [bioreactor metagenome]|uniref:Uncharacterized protein n=1 Tax=bioreactor metagenome TaxID=1076179 RepID=A0A645A2N8_9ZZZZ